MPQSPLAATVARSIINNAQTSLVADANGNLRVSVVTPADAKSSLHDITSAVTVLAAPGWIINVNVVVAGSAAGSINDCATTGAVAAANQIAVTPAATGSCLMNWPALVGITVTPGTGQTLAVAYEPAV